MDSFTGNTPSLLVVHELPVQDAVDEGPLEVAIDAIEDMDNMVIGIVCLTLGRACAEAESGRGHRHRDCGWACKFLDMSESSSHGHSLLKPGCVLS